MPRGKWQGPSTYRPGLTIQLIGVLQSDLHFDGAASFKQWGAVDPSDGDSEEEELPYDALTVYPWTVPDDKKITSGAKVIIEWIAGRWYVTDSNRCPQSV